MNNVYIADLLSQAHMISDFICSLHIYIHACIKRYVSIKCYVMLSNLFRSRTIEWSHEDVCEIFAFLSHMYLDYNAIIYCWINIELYKLQNIYFTTNMDYNAINVCVCVWV